MEESISKAAGSEHGDHVEPETIERLIREIGRIPYERTTTYGRRAAPKRVAAEPLELALAPSPRASSGAGAALSSGY